MRMWLTWRYRDGSNKEKTNNKTEDRVAPRVAITSLQAADLLPLSAPLPLPLCVLSLSLSPLCKFLLAKIAEAPAQGSREQVEREGFGQRSEQKEPRAGRISGQRN